MSFIFVFDAYTINTFISIIIVLLFLRYQSMPGRNWCMSFMQMPPSDCSYLELHIRSKGLSIRNTEFLVAEACQMSHLG